MVNKSNIFSDSAPNAVRATLIAATLPVNGSKTTVGLLRPCRWQA